MCVQIKYPVRTVSSQPPNVPISIPDWYFGIIYILSEFCREPVATPVGDYVVFGAFPSQTVLFTPIDDVFVDVAVGELSSNKCLIIRQ